MELKEDRKANDRKELDKVVSDVREHLQSNLAPITLRNVVHAMFDIHYAEWLAGFHVYPECEYESEANGF
jgi:hypothetical protein